ncbi:MAG: hypothetical protein K8I04_00785 [Gammaproteobacteria bacterium]|nr:hypothetical protein [Gammaproteobacteria bacterium]
MSSGSVSKGGVSLLPMTRGDAWAVAAIAHPGMRARLAASPLWGGQCLFIVLVSRNYY